MTLLRPAVSTESRSAARWGWLRGPAPFVALWLVCAGICGGMEMTLSHRNKPVPAKLAAPPVPEPLFQVQPWLGPSILTLGEDGDLTVTGDIRGDSVILGETKLTERDLRRLLDGCGGRRW